MIERKEGLSKLKFDKHTFSIWIWSEKEKLWVCDSEISHQIMDAVGELFDNSVQRFVP